MITPRSTSRLTRLARTASRFSSPTQHVLRRAALSGLVALALGMAWFLASAPAAGNDERLVGFQARTLAIVNATLVPAPGEEIVGGRLVIRDGVIVAIGPDVKIPSEAKIIDADGLVVYPGLIDAATSDLLDSQRNPQPTAGRDVDFGRYVLAATRPDNRRSLTPEFEASTALKLDSKILNSSRAEGFTALHVLPSGRIAAGQGVLVSTTGAPPRESVLNPSTLAEFQLFSPRGSRYPNTLMGATAHLRQAFLDADRYRSHWRLYRKAGNGIERPPVDAALEALVDVATGKRRPVFAVDSKDDIHRALDFCREHDLQPILWGATEAHRCVERLKAEGADLIVRADFGDEPKIEPPAAKVELNSDFEEFQDPLRAQRDRHARWKERLAGLAKLHDAGIRFSISSRNLEDRGELLKNVRRAIEEGLSPDAALAALTVNAAAILGMEDRLGTLAEGKLGHAVVLSGPIEHKGSKVRYLLVDGQVFEHNEDAEPVDSQDEEKAAGLDLTGTWRLQIESAQGKTAATVELSQSGDRLRGVFHSEQGDGKLTAGSVAAEKVEFVVGIGAGERTIELSFRGKPAGDKLGGTLETAFGPTTKWSAERVPADKSTPKEGNPVALSLDDSSSKDEAETGHSSEQDTGESNDPSGLPTELRSDRLNRVLQTGGQLLVKHATVLTGTGKTLPETSILIRDGKFAEIGPDLEPDEGMAVIDATGRFVMPGIIDTHSHIMITGGVNESSQSIVPEVRIKDVVDSEDPSEYRALAGGTTTARLLHGSANVIGGQDAVVKLRYGKTAAEHILKDNPQGVKFALGENVKFRTTRFPNTRMGVEATLNRAFLEAVDYRRQWLEYERAVEQSNGPSDHLLPPRRDLRLEALADIVNHQKFIHSHCYRADEILMLLRVASNLGIRVWSLQHVLEGYKVAPEIVAHGASCSTFSDWWAYKVEAYDATPYNAALLKEAGANVVVKSDNAELIRHLNLEAAKTVRYGNMHPDDALQTVTLNAARELGLDDRLGSIEVGKDADLAIFSGHPLNAFSRCEQTVIDGEIYFTREDRPSAMSAEAARRSARPTALVFPPAEIRQKRIDLSPAPNGRYAIVGATLHPVDGPSIPGGTLLIDGEKIAALGTDFDIPSDAKVIEAAGWHVYPGLIDAGTTLGLTEIGKVRETHDYSESGGLQPDLRAGVAINPDSELFPVARAGGITTALIRPNGGTIAGQASLIQLAGWTAPDMVLEYEAALQINWPTGSKRKQTIESLRDFLDEARTYDRLRMQAEKDERPGPISDPRLDALRPYLNRKRPVLIEAHSRQQIAEALIFAEQEKLEIVITGGTDAWKLADELKSRDVPVIVGPVMRRPVADYDPFDAPYANPGRLFEAGVRFCIRSDSASNSRNAPFEAAMAVAYGLPEEAALRAVTLSAAEILGMADEVGSLTVGKRGNVLITDGSPLQQTSQVKAIFINGQPFAPESRHTRLYERYRQRLHELRDSQRQAGGEAVAAPE